MNWLNGGVNSGVNSTSVREPVREYRIGQGNLYSIDASKLVPVNFHSINLAPEKRPLPYTDRELFEVIANDIRGHSSTKRVVVRKMSPALEEMLIDEFGPSVDAVITSSSQNAE